jgi:hypothetical protein
LDPKGSVVVLEAGGSISIRCHDNEGDGMAGVVVAVNRCRDSCIALESILAMNETRLGSALPGVDSVVGTAIGTTREDGVVDYDNLAHGEYYVEVWSTRFSRTDFSHRLKVNCPGSLDVPMSEVHCAVLRIENAERLVGWRAIRGRALSGVPAQVAYSGPAFWDLRRRYPGACVLTNIPDGLGGTPDKVAAWIAGYGRVDTVVDLVPVSQFVEPVTIQVPSADKENFSRVRWTTDPVLAVGERKRPPRVLFSGCRFCFWQE